MGLGSRIEVVPITCLLSNPWELLLRCLLCYAMLVDVDWVSDIHDRCEIDNFNGLSKVAT